jgi:hypothetical protein
MKLTTLTLTVFVLCAVHVPLCNAQGGVQDDAAQLKQKLAEQQKQIDALKQAIEEQQKTIDALVRAAPQQATAQPVVQPSAQPSAQPPAQLSIQPSAQPPVQSASNDAATPAAPGFRRMGGEVASITGDLPSTAPTAPAPKPYDQIPDATAKPLSFDIGVAKFTPLGFVDLTNVVRSTDVGSGIGTSFNTIPFNNTTAGHLSESRMSLQNSRIGLRIDSNVLGWNILGYLETDFLGSAPANLVVTSNADPLRLRLFFVDMKSSKFEVLAGQSWSLMTPGRKGISPLPGDIFYSQDMDTNYQVGLTWSRDPGLRLVYHPSDHVAWAIAFENPEQYIGSGIIVNPVNSTLSTAIGTEFDSTTQTSAVPNLHPDIISKLAFDGGGEGHAMHFEVAGLYRTFQSYNPVTNVNFKKAGAGGSVNFNLELAPGFHFIANTFASDGGGRYIYGMGPDLIVRADGSISPVHAYSTVDGFEYSLKPKNNPKGLESMLYAYYGGAYYGRNTALDFSGTTPVPIGYGVYASSASLNANRTIQEATLGLIQTIWKNPTWGDLKLITQYSYLWRDPWYVPSTNTQRKATSNMVFVDLRYDIP